MKAKLEKTNYHDSELRFILFSRAKKYQSMNVNYHDGVGVGIGDGVGVGVGVGDVPRIFIFYDSSGKSGFVDLCGLTRFNAATHNVNIVAELKSAHARVQISANQCKSVQEFARARLCNSI